MMREIGVMNGEVTSLTAAPVEEVDEDQTQSSVVVPDETCITSGAPAEWSP